jgi:hypothetical protein
MADPSVNTEFIFAAVRGPGNRKAGRDTVPATGPRRASASLLWPPGPTGWAAGRLWDVVFLLRCAIGRSNGGPEVRFALHVRNDNRDRTPPLVWLKALCGPGDDGAPCITVMMPEED